MKLAITDIAQLDPNGTYSYADYLTWRFQERVEILKGKLFKMSPAPNLRHQTISSNLHGILYRLFKGHPCKLFHAPFDVRLIDSKKKLRRPDDSIYTVVQPDICIVCDEKKLDEQGCVGAPDWVIEIISPSTSSRDLKDKFRIYEENGVREYWVIFPHDRIIQAWSLEHGKYKNQRVLTDEAPADASIFPNLMLDLKEIFA